MLIYFDLVLLLISAALRVYRDLKDLRVYRVYKVFKVKQVRRVHRVLRENRVPKEIRVTLALQAHQDRKVIPARKVLKETTVRME